MPTYIQLESTASTNTYVAAHAALLPDGAVVYTHRQTAGRGQKGNHWESEPGKNLTFSMLIKRPPVPAIKQFAISEAAALAVTETLCSQAGDGFAIKWPNDIYYHDSKICGLLIENSLSGSDIEHTVIGAGVNINQRRFVSDAPNPISLTNITGQEHDLVQLLHQMCERLASLCAGLGQEEALKQLHSRYLAALYRNDRRQHRFALPDGTVFMASVVDVAPDGMLTLRHHDGTQHAYAFKEVKHVIEQHIL